MLDSLRRRDESERPKDLPPALPARPNSKARRPKRPLPAMFDVECVVSPSFSNSKKQDAESVQGRGSNFGRKRVKEVVASGESPYTMAALDENRLAENGAASLATAPSLSSEAEWDDSIGYFLKQKLRVWCRVRDDQWELGKLKSTVGEQASVMLLDGSVMTVSTGELLPANTEILDGVDNLVELGFLNEPSVLHNLQYRYARDVIYSKAGPVLLAINPFKDVQIFENDFITAYREKILDNPHVYATAAAAYDDMMRDGVNQSIVISGDSGAGKTETANYAIQYLAAAGGGNCAVAHKILKTGYVLDAFGNAKTPRNSNSSRFGKLIDIHYNEEGVVCGAYIHTLLLEKARVSQLCRGERSYHVFYQICVGAPPSLKDRLNLKIASEYKFLNQSGCMKISGVDDAQNFNELVEALDTFQISRADQEHVFELLAAILWLGNISFEVFDDGDYVEVVTDEASESAVRLMGCMMDDLVAVLTQTGGDNMAHLLTPQEAIDTRDALAQFVYERLFKWLVRAINRSLDGGTRHPGRTISIFDAYGFESFQKNGFQQLLINYADERLHQHFIRHLFKLEQEEYEWDGIHWKKVEFEDNQECLNLFEKKPMGLLSILDEESDSLEATDMTFSTKIKQQLSSNPCFNGERGAFRVRHYAGEVKYDTSGFLEKNGDVLRPEIVQLLSSCESPLLNLWASNATSESAASNLDRQSVGTKFKGQLFKLIRRLENSKPHFILCIRPNGKQLPGMYEKDTVLEQLRCLGVMDVARISRSRFPTRLTHQEFADRFGCLLSENIVCPDPLSTSMAILRQYHVPPETYQVGYTKLFFQIGQVDVLEDVKRQVLDGAREVENGFLGGRVLLDFQDLKIGIVTLQSFVRGENARREYDVLKKLTPHLAPGALDENLTAIVRLQSVIRGWLARRYFSHLLNWKKSALQRSRSRRKSRNRISDVKGLSQENISILPQNVDELQRRVVKAESTVSQRDHEITALREQVRQFEARWSEYEYKMKSVEETWQSQMAALQMNLAAAKKSLGAAEHYEWHHHGRQDGGSPSALSFDSDDNMSATHTPANSTPPRPLFNVSTPADSTPLRPRNNGREAANGVSVSVNRLAKEFEQRKQNFEDDVKSISISSTKQVEDYKKLKQRFDTWKKEFKHRLRETKSKLFKGGEGGGAASGADRRARKWWGKLSKKY